MEMIKRPSVFLAPPGLIDAGIIAGLPAALNLAKRAAALAAEAFYAFTCSSDLISYLAS